MVRYGTASDVEQVIDVVQKFAAESPWLSAAPFDRGKFRAFVNSILSSPDGIIVLWVEGEEVRGGMIGGLGEHPFSYQKYAFEYGLYILPQYRGGIAAARMVRAFERRAKELGAHDFRPGIMTGITVDKTTKFYERLGYRQTGTQLIKVF